MRHYYEGDGFIKCYGYDNWNDAPERASSDTVFFGEQWKLGRDNDADWQVYWLEDTGELCAVPIADVDYFIILGYYATREDVEQRMAGWRDYVVKDLAAFFLPPNHPAQHYAKARIEAKLLAWQNGEAIPGRPMRGY